MPSSRDTVGTYESLQEANMQVANVFLFDGYYASSDDPTYEVEGDGGLQIQCNTDGSTGGYTEIFVESAPARRTLGPRKR
jgi:hypothetical protein